MKTVSDSHSANRIHALIEHQEAFAVFTTNENGVIQSWNKGAQNLYRYTSEEVCGKALPETIRPLLSPLQQSAKHALLYKQGYWVGEAVHHDKNGHALTVTESVSLATGRGADELLYICSLVQPEKNHNENSSFDGLAESVTDAVFLTDEDYCVQTWNKGAENLYGYSLHEVKGRKFREVVRPLTSEENFRQMDESIARQQYWSGEVVHRKKDGAIVQVAVSFSLKKKRDGQPGGYYFICRDVSLFRHNEQSVIQLGKMIETTNDAVYSLDGALKVLTWNRAAEKMFGYTAAEVINHAAEKTLRPVLTEEERAVITEELATRDYWYGEIIHLRKNGSLLYGMLSVSVTRNAAGNVEKYICICQDITERKEHEESMKKMQAAIARLTQERLEESLKQISDYKFALDESSLIIIADDNGNIIHVNENFCLVSKFTSADLTGKSFTALKVHQKYQHVLDDIITTLLSGKVWRGELELMAKDASWFWIAATIVPFLNAQGQPEQYTAICIDIKEKKEVEEQIMASRRKYQMLFENNPLPMFMLTMPERNIAEVNKAAINLYGFSKEEFSGKRLRDMWPVNAVKEYAAEADKSWADMLFAGLHRHIKKDGGVLNVEIYGQDFVYEDKPIRLVLVNEVTERIKAEEELKESHEELRRLAFYLQNIREEERSAMAREIHDELGQQITGLKMDVSWVSKKMQHEDEGIRLKLKDILRMLDDTVKIVRKISADLRPGILDDLGLCEALEWYSSEFEKRYGIKTQFAGQVDAVIPKPVTTALFRIYQESLTNVAMHANAAEVEASLHVENNKLVLVIKDNGRGFDNGAAHDSNSLGLLGMKERTHSLGGFYDIKSKPGEGTSVYVTVPLQKK
ncbi:PAS domain S-box protein [Foetidibacter luteolus]|uniref:PAS domain S-box protein n=1 Tax=Foetidibacter luteolus TaxID=2608880 RepID=UPI00129AD6F0|nr:PAS domain S-box protein [Foetidibacter luteolus]